MTTGGYLHVDILHYLFLSFLLQKPAVIAGLLFFAHQYPSRKYPGMENAPP